MKRDVSSHPEETRQQLHNLDPALSSYQSGVWRVIALRPTRQTLKKYWEPIITRWETAQGAAYIFKFLMDVYHLAPVLFSIYLLSHAISGVNDAFTLLYTNQLMSKVENTITSSEGPDIKGIMQALALHLGVKTLSAIWRWAWRRSEPVLNTRISTFCKTRVMKAHLELDLPSSHDTSNILYSTMPYMAQHVLRSSIESIRVFSSMTSQIVVIFKLMKGHDDGVLLVGLCFIHSLFQSSIARRKYSQETIYYASDRSYRRLLALFEIATTVEYKQEVIGGALGDYLMSEYNKAADKTSNATDDPDIFFENTTPFESCATVFLDSLPLIYCIVRVIQNPAVFSLTYLATLQRTSSVIQDALSSVSWIDSLLQNIIFVKSLYVDDSSDAKKIPPGDMPFPPVPDAQPGEGMSIELRDVSFQYPGKESDKFALRNISFTIPPSSLVVIVGVNGSGKTSIVKLLAQLYRPTSGQLIIQDQPAQTYKPQDLYNATALLTQKHSIFPLTMAENIGVGDPEDADNFKKIVEAARLGGASELIDSLEDKWNQELEPVQTCGSRCYKLSDGPLKELRKTIEKVTEISGGESQRLAAARTFMRIMSDKTKLVIVDEPTSAIDPTGEYELFERLRDMRKGKTMVFVTHRFGHLTKHADLILCMKAGELAESGTHQELMKKGGEYCKLYEVQAKAFTDNPS